MRSLFPNGFPLIYLFAACFLTFGALDKAVAEDPLTTASIEAEKTDTRLSSLKQVLGQIERLEAQRQALKDQLNAAHSDTERAEAQKQIQTISDSIQQLTENFSEISSGVDLLRIIGASQGDKLDLAHEIQDLVIPLVNEIKRATSRPREMERLRTGIQHADEKLRTLTEGAKRLEQLSKNTPEKISQRLNQIHHDFFEAIAAISTDRNVMQERLEQRKAQEVSIGESVQQILQLFFKSRGRNFIVAVLLVFVTIVIGNKAKASLLEHRLFTRATRSVYGKGILLAISTCIGALGIIVPIVFLYLVGDWILLTVVLLILVGVIWASKQALLRFWGQTVLLLNMGAVREGERIVFNGIPFLVRSINLFSILENPALSGGVLRVPIADLETLRSRSVVHHESWFPTMERDWVLLSDGALAKVVTQTVESVRVIHLGGAQRTFTASQFIELNPLVLSHGYRISISFGIDYDHQKIVTEVIPPALQTALSEALVARGLSAESFTVQAEFGEAAASSLNIMINLDLPGDQASQYQSMQHLISSVCLDTCTARGWTLPFEQMTVHLRKE
jgi:outer membrane murein-binding lipoprotein Lpp